MKRNSCAAEPKRLLSDLSTPAAMKLRFVGK